MKHKRCAIRTYVSSVTCDRCAATATVDDPEAAEFLGLDLIGGYTSALGDGSRAELDLCTSCVKEVLGPWLRITDGPLVEHLKAFNVERHGGEFPTKEPDLPLVQSRPHEEFVVASLRSDAEFAAEYLNQVMRDGDTSEIQLAVRRAALAEILDPTDAKFLLRGLESLRRSCAEEGIPAEEVIAKLRAKLSEAREAIAKRR